MKIRKSGRKSGLALTPTVFQALHKALLSSFKENYKLNPDSLVDYQLYGFNYYDETQPSIKNLILEKTGKWVNGKYLYNKYREWKKGINPIQFTREFVFIYFQTLGLKDINEFIQTSDLTESRIQEQLSLTKPIPSVDLKEDFYVGYYEGEEGSIIYCKLTLIEQTEQAQIDLIYWEEEKEFSEYTYSGAIIYQQNGMSFFFRNEDTILDRSQFIGIYCERQIKVKPFLVGTISGYDRDRRPVVAEIIFQKVDSMKELKAVTKNKKVNSIIAQYLSGRRWTVENKMIQKLVDLSPLSKHAKIIENFLKPYKGVFISIKHGIFVIELTVNDNTGNSTFRIAGHPVYKGLIKVQASGQLLVGSFVNMITQVPLYMSIEVLAIREQIFTGDLMGVSRFDESFSGKIYISVSHEFTRKIPEYRGSELTNTEIQKLPPEILGDQNKIFESNKLDTRNFSSKDIESANLSYLAGSYIVEFAKDKVKETSNVLELRDSGKVSFTHKHLVYQGQAMVCEGGVLSIYFTSCNNIPHCGQILGNIGKKSKAELTSVKASWFHLDENYNHQTTEIYIISLIAVRISLLLICPTSLLSSSITSNRLYGDEENI